MDANEAKHLKSSMDGLSQFYPVDIYPENIVSIKGLLTTFRRLQMLEWFGILDHDRVGFYSLLHVDVKIYWQLLRMLYSYSGMATLRHDLFLCFGLWHAYSYAHVALWTAFRPTFLADVFWSVFPKQRLLRRPPRPKFYSIHLVALRRSILSPTASCRCVMGCSLMTSSW